MDSLNRRCLSPSYPHNPSLEESRTDGCVPEWVGSFAAVWIGCDLMQLWRSRRGC